MSEEQKKQTMNVVTMMNNLTPQQRELVLMFMYGVEVGAAKLMSEKKEA